MKNEAAKALESVVAREYGNITGIVVRQNGAVCYERYFRGFAASDAVHVFSVTKSVVSALVGVAIAQGFIKSVEQKVLGFFPDYSVDDRAPGDSVREVTVRHLLTMTAPWRCEEEPYEAFFTSGHWVNAALDLLGGESRPGEFRYSAIVGAHILPGILRRAVGRPVLEFARENLFAPLGIDVPGTITFASAEEQLGWYAREKHENGWVADAQGTHTGGWGLTLAPADMAKIGQLYLDGGVWNGRQVLPAAWVAQSTAEHSRWAEQNLAYGCLWWVPAPPGEKAGIFAAMGDGGNAIYVNREKRLVVAIGGLFTPEAGESLSLIADYIEPLFG